MKRIALIIIMVLSYTLNSCSKDSKDPDEVPDNTPLQLVKRIHRYEFNGQIWTDSVRYTYDTAGHLTGTIDAKTNQPRRKYIYEGDNLTALIDYTNVQGDTLKNPVKLLDGGNTIFLDHTGPNPNGGIDTIQLTYKWSGNQLREAWTYLNLAATGIPHLQKTIISYNADGNLYEDNIVSQNGSTSLQYRALAYDQKKNYFANTFRLNYIFMGWGFPDATRSVNNPIKAEQGGGGQVEYIWTYNQADYPLTMQIKGKNYLSTELQYNK